MRSQLLFALLLTLAPASFAQEVDSVLLGLSREAEALRPLVRSPLAHRLLDAVAGLPAATERTVYFDRAAQDVVSEAAFAALDDSVRARYEPRVLPPAFYYYTRYGTPLATARAFDLLAEAGFTKADGARVLDFGFGSIGQLRLLASLGAEATGVDVDPLLAALYSRPDDTGPVARAPSAGDGPEGRLELRFGQFPADAALVEAVGTGYDLFISKNTLKRGYIHPEREVDPRRLVHLGVDDAAFVRALRRLLKPGGLVMIYNLHPAQNPDDEPYIPWADGRSPFDRALYEAEGFEVLAFDQDDTAFARQMGRALGWDASMDLDQNLFATYTLLRSSKDEVRSANGR